MLIFSKRKVEKLEPRRREEVVCKLFQPLIE
jgi:hypothetical protein